MRGDRSPRIRLSPVVAFITCHQVKASPAEPIGFAWFNIALQTARITAHGGVAEKQLRQNPENRSAYVGTRNRAAS